jgi:2-polyprenyl-3-methyl-5-hydroxy-6-metoxy-1,4-benzoquinol methylase
MDRERVEAFLDRFVELAAASGTIALLAVADRSGLTAWLAKNGGGTSSEIAEGSGLHERYVREICSGLAAAGVLEHRDGGFSLPPEHAMFLADEASPYFMGGYMDMIPALYDQIDGVASATRSGGGVPFEAFGEGLVKGLDKGNRASQQVLLPRKWLPAIPTLHERLTEGIRVADIGCGSGAAVMAMASAYPNSTFVGYDVSPELLALATERSEGMPNVTFEQTSVEELPDDTDYDLVTAFDVVHDLADPLSALKRVRESLRPGGVFLMMEPNASSDLDDNLGDTGALLYAVSALYCMTQSLAQDGAGLGAAWGRQAAEDLAREAGFGWFQEVEPIRNRFSSFYLLAESAP